MSGPNWYKRGLLSYHPKANWKRREYERVLKKLIKQAEAKKGDKAGC